MAPCTSFVVLSAIEIEAGVKYANCQDAVFILTSLEAVGHPKLATPVQIENQCSRGILNKTVK